MGILDFWNEQPPSPYTPQMRQQAGFAALGQLGGGLLAAGAPTTDPSAYGRILGASMANMGPNIQANLDSQLQMSEWQKEQDRLKKMQDFIAGGGGGLLSPEELAFLENAPPEVGMGLLGDRLFAQQDAGDPFTLSPGQNRYDANGNIIAEGPTAPTETAEIVMGSALGLGGDMANRAIEVKRDQSGNIVDYSFAPAGNSTTVTMPPAETEFQKSLGKYWGEQYGAMQSGAAAASSTNANLDQMTQLLDQGVATGAGAGTMLDFDKMALAISERTGIDLGVDPATVGSGEAMRALGNKMALELRNPDSGAGMPGSMSDADREFLISSMPGLSLTPEGNRILIGLMRKVNERKIQVARLADQYIQENGTLNAGFNDYLKANLGEQPLVTPEERAAIQSVVSPGTPPPSSTGKYRVENGQLVPVE